LKEGGFYIFLENSLSSAPGKGRPQRLFFYFFKKNLVPSALAKAVGKDGFLFF
jgi:hypothetical protein